MTIVEATNAQRPPGLALSSVPAEGPAKASAAASAVDRRFSVVRHLLDTSDMNAESIMSQNVQVCRSHQTAQSALRLMRDHDCGCIPIVDHDAVVGIVTDRDIALAAAEADKSPSQLRLSQIMTSNVFVVRPNTPIVEAEQLMREQKIRRLPVVDENSRPVGILSLNDIARAGATHRWKSEDGLSARQVASTLADICESSESVPGPLA